MSTSSIVALAVMLAGVGPQLTNTPMHAGSPSANDRLAAVKSGAAPMNGVNLGSWLVLEKWMAPAPWDGISGEPWGERQLMLTAAQQGKTAQVRQAIKQHRDSWVKEEDFITMEAAGINAVRLPVGFWVVAGTAGEAVPFVEGGLAYVDKAMEWGAKHGIGVLLDMHAAPGSQNGFDHSAPAQKNKALWDSANQPSPSYPAQTLAVIKTLAQRYGSAPALLGFAPLNEPTIDAGKLRAYYEDAYAAIRAAAPDCFIAISPRNWEQDGSEWQNFMAAAPYTKVLQDLHRYQLDWAGPQFNSMSVDQHVQFAMTRQRDQVAGYLKGGGLPPVFGEYALAGPNYHFDGRHTEEIPAFYAAQRSAFMQPGSAGAFIWSLKNSVGNDVWSFEGSLRNGWLGNPAAVAHAVSTPAAPATPAAVPGAASGPAAQLAAVKNGAAQMRGVNLGSWLVLEKWMSPKPWDGIDGDPWGERQLMLAAKRQGKTAQVRDAIIAHRDSWVTEADFVTMAGAGVNAVRLPIGFWVAADTAEAAAPFVEGGVQYVDKAMEWGAAHGIGILIDMHAAPGSQNGFDHSAPAQKNKALWDSANQPSPSYPAQTLAVIKTLAQRYGSSPALLGFAALNEPTVDAGKLRTYYTDAYAAVRKWSPDCFFVVSPRNWEQGGSEWQNFMVDGPYTKVLQDIHKYQLDWAGAQFGSMSVAQHTAWAQRNGKHEITSYIERGGLPIVIGEWALAGPNYHFAEGRHAPEIQAFFTAQQAAFMQPGSAGAFIWSLKNDVSNDVWSFEGSLRNGWIGAGFRVGGRRP